MKNNRARPSSPVYEASLTPLTVAERTNAGDRRQATRVIYRETIHVREESKGTRQAIGGRGHYRSRGSEDRTARTGQGSNVDAIKGGTVPREYIPAVEKGARDTPDFVMAGYPVVDVSRTLFSRFSP
jgi:translation elongation factor EF-G